MPEGLEAEIWRRALQPLAGRTIATVWVDERVGPAVLADIAPGCVIGDVTRHGKVVVVHTDGPAIGLHFGMTGRVVVDGAAPIARLEYASGADRPDWDRLRVWTSPSPAGDVPAIRMNDPRRLGRVSIDPDTSHLGADLLGVDAAALAAALGRRRLAVKSALLDQRVVAGLGNLCADEVLWWAGIAPQRPVGSLAPEEIRALAGAIRRRMPIMLRRGGSTMGTLTPDVRRTFGPCPRDGTELRRESIAGRTAVWCPTHQR
jgi:formamidopyrimidine-DNA glycosylase